MVLNSNSIDWLQVWQQAKGHLAYAIGVLTLVGYGLSFYHQTQREMFILHERVEELRDEIAKLTSTLEIANNDRTWLRADLERCYQKCSNPENYRSIK